MYNELTSKQKRTVEIDLSALYTPKAFLEIKTIEEIRRLGLVAPFITHKGSTRFLSERGFGALRRLADTIHSLPSLSSSVSHGEVSRQTTKAYEALLEQYQQPNGEEFVQIVAEALLMTVKDREFLVKIAGLDLKGQDRIDLGSLHIQRADPLLLNSVDFTGLDVDWIQEEFKGGLWIVCSVRGSPEIATEIFEDRVRLAIGTLAVWGCVFYRGAIWHSGVRALLSPDDHRQTAVTLEWEEGGENPSLKRNCGFGQSLTFDSKMLQELDRKCSAKQFGLLPELKTRNELQDAILRSLYWFAEAYRDPNWTMQFVKLWSCVECFFALQNDEISERNARGFTSILTFGGFKVVEAGEYLNVKARIKKLYQLRSKAVHRASFGHIQGTDLNDLSFWTAWLIVTMVSLAQRGYHSLRQVEAETVRLDKRARIRP